MDVKEITDNDFIYPPLPPGYKWAKEWYPYPRKSFDIDIRDEALSHICACIFGASKKLDSYVVCTTALYSRGGWRTEEKIDSVQNALYILAARAWLGEFSPQGDRNDE